jgi:ankyrin repeat protein
MTNRTLTRLSLAALFATAGTLYAAAPAVVAPVPDPRLPEAVQHNDVAVVKSLLLHHVAVDSAEGDGSTGLHWAAYSDNLALAKLLLDAHANVHATTRLQAITPLMMACMNGSAAMINLLLAHGANATEANSLGTTALMMAAASGNTAAVQTLLDHGANPNATEKVHGQTALIFAASLDRADVISLLIAHKADPNAATKVTPIVRAGRGGGGFMPPTAAKPEEDADAGAASAGDAKEEPKRGGRRQKPAADGDAAAGAAPADIGAGTPKELQSELIPGDAGTLKNAPAGGGGRRGKPAPGAPTAVADGVNGTTPADAKAPAVPRPERGATMMGGMTPLLFAARQGNTAAAKALLAGGADVNEVSGSEKTTPLVLAIANGHYDTARAILEAGANPNLANVMGVTALYATIDVQWAPHEWSPEPVVAQEHTGYLELMQMLLDHKADPNARLGRKIWSRALSEDATWVDAAGATAFWRAAQADDLAAMKLLVKGGADANIATNAGVTPMMVASGLGWGMNYSQNAPGSWIPAIDYCISLGNNPNAHADNGFTALYGPAFTGNNDVLKFLVAKGAKADGKNKAGDSAADYSNGPFQHSIPHADTLALLESLGSPNSHNCRSDQCLPAPTEDKRGGRGGAAAAAAKDDAAPEMKAKKPVPSVTPAVTATPGKP